MNKMMCRVVIGNMLKKKDVRPRTSATGACETVLYQDSSVRFFSRILLRYGESHTGNDYNISPIRTREWFGSIVR